MSLGINVTIPEGIVLAADSRQTYRNQKGMARVGSDSASKVFRIGSRMGLVIAGLAFLPQQGVMKNVSGFIDDFRQTIPVDKLSVGEVAKELAQYFDARVPYRDQLKNIPAGIKADMARQSFELLDLKEEPTRVVFHFKNQQGQVQEAVAVPDGLQFVLGGYNKDKSSEVYMVYVPGATDQARDSRKQGKEYGAGWIGQTDVVTRIVLGFDPRLQGIPLVREAAVKLGEAAVQQQLRGVEYSIQWGTMTLQDAVDFCQLAIETTTAIQRFSDGVLMDPGDMTGVGGPIDMAVITYDKGFTWLNRKHLRSKTGEVDLEDLPSLEK
jgi:20S proteasome alpha/beta subunit